MNNEAYIGFGDKNARTVFIQAGDEHDLSLMGSERDHAAALSGRDDFCIAFVPVEDWNADLAPWPAPPVFGKIPFGDGASRTLDLIMERVIPELEDAVSGRTFYLCGYSLAGLFALWAAYNTPIFAGVAAVSPSVWYPDWIDYAAENDILTKRVYLSLGDREARAKNTLLASVGDAICRQYELLSPKTDCTLEWNKGNHFVDSDIRTAKGIAWLLSKRDRE